MDRIEKTKENRLIRISPSYHPVILLFFDFCNALNIEDVAHVKIKATISALQNDRLSAIIEKRRSRAWLEKFRKSSLHAIR